MKIFSKISNTIVSELKSGWSIQSIASSIVVGVAIGIFPVLGSTTALVFVAAKYLKLNQVVCQAVNYLVYPLQIMLWLPMMFLGASLLGIELQFNSIEEFKELLTQNTMVFFTEIIWYQLAGVFVWALLVLPFGAGLYCLIISILKKNNQDQK